MSEKILLVDDDDRLAAMLQQYLNDAGFDVTTAGTGQQGLDYADSTPFGIIILDLMLPDIDGLDVCRALRQRHNTPILMLTAKGDPMDRIVGLELGADDYLGKPFEPRELLARLRAILRRGVAPLQAGILKFGRLEINPDTLEAYIGERKCELTAYQFQLLTTLAKRAGRVLSRDYLMVELQGTELEAFDRSIDVHISRIRHEIEDNPKQPRRVITVRGAGYVFARSQD